MMFLIIAVGFSFLSGVLFCCYANSDRLAPAFLGLMCFCCGATITLCLRVGIDFDRLFARQQLLEQKCVQAGLAVMKTVATEERFEFIDTPKPAAEQKEGTGDEL